MQLGIYKRESPTGDDTGTGPRTYEQLALYDFETSEWDDTSDGWLVAKASRNPSPEELVVRFQLERHDTIVCTPERLTDNGHDITIADADMTVDEGHDRRDQQGGPLHTQVQKQHHKDLGVIVIPDDYESERGIPENAVRESDFDNPFDFAAEFDFEFYTSSESNTDTDSEPDRDDSTDAEPDTTSNVNRGP